MDFLSRWRWELCSPLAGLLLTFAFSPFNYSYLAVASLVFVFLSWLGTSPVRVALRGYLYGLGLFGSGISWVYISIHDYGGAPIVGSLLLTILVVCFWALFPALTGYLSVKIAGKKNKNKLIWLIPFVWILVEYFRGYWLLNGFPWLQIAYTQLGTPLQGFVPVMGVYGTGFLLAITASLIAAGCIRNIKYLNVGMIITLLWGAGAYIQTIKWTEPIAEAITVALIQGNVAQDKKWLPEYRIKTLVDYQQMTVQNWGSDVIIWPETAIPAYLSQVKAFYLDPLSAKAKAHNTDLIVSLPATGRKNEYFNTVLTLGNHEGRYDKNHLLPFGEYLPLQPLSGFVLNLLNIRLGNFTSGGNDQKLLQAGGYPFATSICYEDAFGNEAIRGLPKAAYLVNVTNDAWFGDSLEPHQHMQLAQMRALETGRYMLRATNTGVTAIVAPDGAIVKKAPMFKKTVLTGHFFPMGGMTPYARLGDNIISAILGFFLLVLIMWKNNTDES
ncbi:MAG: apolipoprotein N-acyltransferase [Methylococcaceae bacterium]|nr:apolipoprotein N-acyltransferase [Methylococcaceae bacterium]